MEEGVHQHAKGWQRRTDCRKSRLTVTEDSKAKQPKATSQKSERRNVPPPDSLGPPASLGHKARTCASCLFIRLLSRQPPDPRVQWPSPASP